MIRQGIIREIQHEGSQTKRILERIPVENFNWKPHEKSREIGQLAIHVAQIPAWTSRILAATDFDMLTFKREIPEIKSNNDLIKISEENIQKAADDLQKVSDEDLMTMWSFKRGEQVIFSLPRAAAIRNMSMNHLIHHRGQLSVYLRLLNIPVPGMYGASADEM
jgi:uncharacterized damage-inducible protein DinB